MKFKPLEECLAIPLRNGLTKPKKVRGQGYKMVNMGELFSTPIINELEMDRVPLTDKEKVSLLEAGDLLFARQSLVREGAGQCSIFWDDAEEVCFESHIIRCRIDRQKADPLFLFYYFQSKLGKSNVDCYVEQGAGAAGIRGTDLLKVLVPDIDVEHQRKVAKALYQLDRKIKNNFLVNQTLEQMAQAIFKSWFVDFDPVKAKMNGEQPDGMDAVTASLFPDKLVESELGLTPEGWDVLPLSKYINIKHGFAFKGEYFSDKETGDICVTPGNFRIGGGIKLDKLKYYDGPIPEDYIFSKGDLMVTMTDLSKQADTLGYPAFVPESEGKTYLHNQRIGKVELKIEQDIKNYLYSFFCSSGYRNEVLSGVTGSTVKHTAPKKIMAIEVALDLRVADKFSQLVAPLFEKKAQNLVENSYLEKLRDTLLPKLLSGEIELGEVEEQAEVN
ncbi:restriction endonuclease subunit S [Vibrio parahaemolyticus]